jgi:hypothetical protein
VDGNFSTSGQPGEGEDFGSATTGGWDVLFPNDEAWRGHPDHGRLWNTRFTVESIGPEACTLSLELDEPPASITRTFTMLDPPRAGLREQLLITALADVGPCLVASHPALAAEVGWRIELPPEASDVAVDRDYPGRFRPEQELGPRSKARPTGRSSRRTDAWARGFDGMLGRSRTCGSVS